MKATGSTATLALLLALASGQAVASAARPLQLGYAAPAPRTTGFDPARMPAAAMPEPRRQAALRAGPRTVGGVGAATPRFQALRQQALASVLEPAPLALEPERGDGALQLKFEKRGHALRDLQRGYQDMCNRVSEKIWDEPNGKRVRFDVRGKPGIGIEIPLGRRQASR